MNKKLFLGMFAAAGMLFATSCSNDELDQVQSSSDQAQVTFSLATEGSIATRATISDGTKANKLVYAVYKLNALTGVPELQNVIGSNNGQIVKDDFKSGYNVELTLAKGQTYQVAFWAQDGDCKAYNTADLTSVKVSYKAENSTDNAANNDELRDAFFKTVQFEVKGDKNIDVVLQRPFAQINVGVEQTDWNAAVASGIKVLNSEVEINNVANEINLLTGAVKGDETITYALNTIPNETLYVETDNTKDGKESYVWLSMSYVLVNDGSDSQPSFDGAQKSTLNGLKYTFAPENGNSIEFMEGLAGAPVQRNWRTNILGKILTGDVQFNITIDPAYEGDYNYPEASGPAKELIMKATFGGIYTQTEDFDLEGDAFEIKADFTYNIEDNKTLTSGSAANYGIIVQNGTTTINGNGNIKSEGGGIGIVGGATLIFNGGNLDVNSVSTSGRYLFYLEGAGSKATINGGNFDFNKTQNQKRAYIYAGEGTTVYVNGGTFGKASTRSGYTAGILTNGTGKVIITGGTFGFDPTTWVADDYKAVKSGDKWYVVSESVEAIASNDTELRDNIKNGKDVLLVEDITTDDLESNGYGSTGININGTTIDGNGNAINVTGADGTWDSAIAITSGTIKNITVAQGFRGIFIKSGSSKVVLENVVIDGPVYTISCDQASNQGLEAYNSTFNGWTSYAKTIGNVKFVSCNFGEGAGYAFCRPYAPTTFVGCNFENGYEIDARASVTFENCKIGGVALTADNLATLVTYNIENATVK